MDRTTVEVYEARAKEWRDQRAARYLDRAELLTTSVRDGSIVADLGCGAGLHLPHLPRPGVALDASMAMVQLARDCAPDVPGVRADLEALPFGPGTLGGTWARASYLHVDRDRLPLALADLHRVVEVDGAVHLSMMRGTGDGPIADDDFPGRRFSQWQPDELVDVMTGAGFSVVDVAIDSGSHSNAWIHVLARRARTLPDTVGPGMRLLVCGLNPSVYSADAGIGFARPGNRFWPAALAAGVVTRDRDPRRALLIDRVGMTDLVKRATPRADELSRDEYRTGAARIERLVAWLQPGAVCFVGLTGWRAAIDRRAQAGPQPVGIGGRPAYVMPSTSGLNARVPPAELADHLRAALALAST